MPTPDERYDHKRILSIQEQTYWQTKVWKEAADEEAMDTFHQHMTASHGHWEYVEGDTGDGPPLEEKKSIVVKAVCTVLATSDKEVAMLAAKAIPNDYDDKLEQVEIVVRPF